MAVGRRGVPEAAARLQSRAAALAERAAVLVLVYLLVRGPVLRTHLLHGLLLQDLRRLHLRVLLAEGDGHRGHQGI